MFTKTIVIIVMIIILISLATSLVFLLRDEGKTKRTVNSLSWRVGLSITLFIFLFLASGLEWMGQDGI
jgi:hypothetical protein